MSLRLAIDARILDRKGMERSGVGRYALEISRGIRRVRPDWRIHVHVNRPELFATDQVDVRTTRWPTQSSAGRIAWLHAGSMREWARDTDVLFGTAFVLPFWWSGPSVVTIHDLVFLLLRDRYKGRLNARYASAATRRSARRSTAILCGTRETRGQLVSSFHLDPEKVVVAPYGVGDRFGARQPFDPGTTADPYLLYVGTFEARKGLWTLLQALDDPDFPPVRLVMAGRAGWKVDEVLTRLRRNAAVSVVTDPDDESLAELYRGALALVYPSEAEGFGLPVAEAMASGTPVIASELDGIREFAADAPLYIAPGDGRALARRVASVLDDHELRRKHRALGLAAAGHLTWDAVAERTAQAIERAGVRS